MNDIAGAGNKDRRLNKSKTEHKANKRACMAVLVVKFPRLLVITTRCMTAKGWPSERQVDYE